MQYIKEWGTINWFSKSLWFRVFEQAEVLFCLNSSSKNRVGKCSEISNRNRRSFWAPARGRKVNIYCLPFSSFKFRQYLLFFSPSHYFHCLLLWTLRAITVNHLGDTLVHIKNEARKPGLLRLHSEIMQYIVACMIFLWHSLLTLLDFLLVADPGRVLLFNCEELELSSSSSSSSSSKFMLLEMPEEKAPHLYKILIH